MAKKRFNRNDGDEGEQGYERSSVVPSGRQEPPANKLSYELIDSFLSGYEQVEHEVMATDVISIGRLREMFQAWIVPRMPDPLPLYLEEMDRRGYHLRITYDGSQALFLRRRMNPDEMKYALAADELSSGKYLRGMAGNEADAGLLDASQCCAGYDEEEDDETTGPTSVGAVIEMMRSRACEAEPLSSSTRTVDSE